MENMEKSCMPYTYEPNESIMNQQPKTHLTYYKPNLTCGSISCSIRHGHGNWINHVKQYIKWTNNSITSLI